MRWKLLRRRWSVSAPRVTVRSRMPWPLRWLILALMMGCSAALALWVFEFGKEITGLDRDARTELTSLRDEVGRLRDEHDRALSVANTADSLLKAAQTTQESLAARVKSLEAENLALTRDLGFFEKLMPTQDNGKPLALRGLQVTLDRPGHLRYQALLMQAVGRSGEFRGRYELTLTGTQEGRPWTQTLNKAGQSIEMKQYQRMEGTIDLPAGAVVKQLEIKVLDAAGKLQASEVARM
ncbi:DUF6776 family protein [Sphaerotilus sp.]|uniref:DUF6776 family protein n=1 Tax=Sphaerotilus sp. TaxID=2093942 RepID=UPI0025D2D629|nr:DUF6776 family protein [Sphaerotilus sp.]